MSDHLVLFIPLDPRFIPGADVDAAARDLLRAAAPEADEVSSGTDDHVVFRDCGENFEAVRCPGCGTQLAIATWQAWMDADYDGSGFRLQAVTMPCCGIRETLNGLAYDPAQGFSRYVLTGANIERELPPSTLGDLERTLGCRLRVVRQMI